MMAEGRGDRAQTGESIMVPRYDIVPIPPALRSNLAPGSIMEFPFEVVESMYAFRANDVVGKIAPRPLLLLHPSNDSVTPTEQSIDLFLHAGQPTDLHLVANVDHFLLSEDNPRVVNAGARLAGTLLPGRAGARMSAAAREAAAASSLRPTTLRALRGRDLRRRRHRRRTTRPRWPRCWSGPTCAASTPTASRAFRVRRIMLTNGDLNADPAWSIAVDAPAAMVIDADRARRAGRR